MLLDKIKNNFKSCLKRKIKFTLGILVSFLITGHIGYSIELADTIYKNK